MIVLLADNHLAYRGTLTDMCKFLDVASRDSRTNAKIKTAIENLEKSGKIKTIKDGNTWTLTLAKKAERDKQIIRISAGAALFRNLGRNKHRISCR